MTLFFSLIIPAYNEEKRLPDTLEQVFHFFEKQGFSWEVIVVENGSTDQTFEVARGFAEQHASLRVIRSQRGKGAAVRRGMLDAKGEYRFMCDADLSMPIEELLKFIPPALEDFDIAIASREAQGSVRYDEPRYRHLGGRAINLITQLLILPGLNDTQCGFKCFRAQVADDLFRLQTLDGWAFDIELLHVARRHGYRIREIPIDWIHRTESKVHAVRDAIRMIGDIFLIHFNTLRGFYDKNGAR